MAARAISRWVLLAIVLAAFVTRAGYAAWVQHSDPPRSTTNDTPSYIEPARALVTDGHFDEAPGSDEPMYLRTPGYPLFVAIGLWARDSLTTVVIIQSALVTSGIVLAWWICRDLYDETTGLVAAALMALDPLQFTSSGMLLTEGLNGLVLLTFALCTYRTFRGSHPSPAWALGMGLSLTAATFLRPTTLYLPILLGLIIIGWGLIRRCFNLPLVVALILFLLPNIVGTLMWQQRNAEQLGSHHFSGIDALSTYKYKAAGAIAQQTGTNPTTEADRLMEDFGTRSNEAQGPYYDRMASRGAEIIKDTPKGFVISSGKGLFSEVLGVNSYVEPYLGITRWPTPVELLLKALLSITYAFAGWGIVVAWKHPPRLPHVLVLCLPAYVLIVSVGPEAYTRFRAPISALIILFIAPGVVAAARRLRTRTMHEPTPVGA